MVCQPQLGHGSGSRGRQTPKRVESLRKMVVVGIATGTEHTAVVSSAGTVSLLSIVSWQNMYAVSSALLFCLSLFTCYVDDEKCCAEGLAE